MCMLTVRILRDMNPAFLAYTTSPWVEETLSQLSLRAQIAQSLHIPAWSERGVAHLETLQSMVRTHQIGGIIFFQGTATEQAHFTQTLQADSPIPLLISQDAEWGLAMRLRDQVKFPYGMTLGAIQDMDLIHATGRHMAVQLRQLGVHINYAPVVDVNTEPDNPVIGFRAFHADPHQVGRRAKAFMQGLMAGGIVPVAKHFPGHGDTAIDSHLAMPTLLHDADRLREVELVPFRQLIEAGLPLIMSAHLHVPVWDDVPERTVTLSQTIIPQRLRQQLGFKGICCTDALDMGGVAHEGNQAAINTQAYLAGHDILLFVQSVSETLDSIEAAVEQGRVSVEEVAARCRKNLALKAALGLHQEVAAPTLPATPDPSLWQQLADASLTYLGQDAHPHISPDQPLEIHLVSIEPLQTSTLRHHELISTGVGHPQAEFDSLFPENDVKVLRYTLDQSTVSIPAPSMGTQSLLVVTDIPLKAKQQFGLTAERQTRLGEWIQRLQSPLVWLGNPYALRYVPHLELVAGLWVTYEDHFYARKALSQALMGKQAAPGVLPFDPTLLAIPLE